MHVAILETIKRPASNVDLARSFRVIRNSVSPAPSRSARLCTPDARSLPPQASVPASALPQNRTPFGYDAAGNRNAEMDARANTTYYLYDVGNRLANIIDPLGNSAYNDYDANSNLTQTVDNNLTFVYFGYDALDRRTRILYTNGGYGVQPYGTSPYGGLFVAQYFEYDAGGNLSSTLDDWGGSYFAYDTLNRLSKRSTPRVDAVYYGYDAASNLTRLQYPQGLNACYYGYDASQRMSQLLSPETNPAYYTYDADSNVTKKQFGNGMISWATFDGANRVSSLRYAKSDNTPIVYFDYARDVAGRILTIGRENDLAIYYAYDNVDRLTKETWRKKSDNAQVYAFSYSYDSTGNRLQMRREGASAETESAYYSYAADNSLTKKRNQSTATDTYYYYDANGDRTAMVEGGSPTYYQYGANLLLTAIAPPSEAASYFYYDGLLNRYCINKAGTVSYYLWDGLNLLEERDVSGNLLARYTHGYTQIPGIGSVVEVQRTADGATYYQYLSTDHRGSVYDVTDASQNSQLSYTMDAFGRQLAGIGGNSPTTPNELIYQTNWRTVQIGGKWYGLSRARLYDIETGQYLMRDVVWKRNRYTYCKNNPNNYVDPTGMDIESLIKELMEKEGELDKNPDNDKKTKLTGEIQQLKDKITDLLRLKDFDVQLIRTILNDGTGFYFVFKLLGLKPLYSYVQRVDVTVTFQCEGGANTVVVKSTAFDIVNRSTSDVGQDERKLLWEKILNSLPASTKLLLGRKGTWSASSAGIWYAVLASQSPISDNTIAVIQGELTYSENKVNKGQIPGEGGAGIPLVVMPKEGPTQELKNPPNVAPQIPLKPTNYTADGDYEGDGKTFTTTRKTPPNTDQ
jgi:RHS repeat-associated protein